MCKKVISSFIVMGLIISASLTFADSSDAVFLGKNDTVILEKNFSDLEFKGATDIKDVKVVEISEEELEKIIKEIEGNMDFSKFKESNNIITTGISVAPIGSLKDRTGFDSPEKSIKYLEKSGVKLTENEKKMIKNGEFIKIEDGRETIIFNGFEKESYDKKGKK